MSKLKQKLEIKLIVLEEAIYIDRRKDLNLSIIRSDEIWRKVVKQLLKY